VKSDLGELTWLVERCRGLSVTPAHVLRGTGLRAGKDASKPSADLERGFNMKQNKTSSPQTGEPRNEKPGRKKRFLIVKLEERLAPSNHGHKQPPPVGCTSGCVGYQG
jgi:hypothetical protein